MTIRPTPESGGDAHSWARHLDQVLQRVDEAIDRAGWTTEQIRSHQEGGLRRLLAHSIEHSPFHAERLAGVDPDSFALDDLASLPTMTKRQVMGEFDRVVTDRHLTREAVDRHVASAPKELEYILDEYLPIASGGSSGERGVFVYDKAAFAEFVLNLMRPAMANMRDVGITSDTPVESAIIGGGATVHGSGAIGALLGQVGSPVRMTRIPATLPTEELVRRLNEMQPPAITAYPTVLARLAAEKTAGRLTIEPLSLNVTSEPLTDEARVAIEAAFGLEVGNTYGCSEGLSGMSRPGENAFVFADESCIVELVDTHNRPVGPGEVSAKVLLTNLYNLTQPLIRYELTDRFRVVPGPHPDGHLRATIEGRTDEPFRFGTVLVHPLVVRSVLVRRAEVYEYQVHQRASGIEVHVIADSTLDCAGLAAELAQALTAAGLEGAEATVEPVESIPRDPATGKARRFVPLS